MQLTAIPVRDLVERTVRAAGAEARLAEIQWGAVETPAGEAPLVVAGLGRLEGELGWRPTVGLDRGLERTIDWWREHLATAHTA